MSSSVSRFFAGRLIDFSSQTDFGVTIAGEYSNGFNDCGFYLMSTEPYTPANPNCEFWNDWQSWDQATKDGLLNFALASMDALEYPFFWNWKVRKAHTAPHCHKF